VEDKMILFAFLIVGERFLTAFFQINVSDLTAAGGALF